MNWNNLDVLPNENQTVLIWTKNISDNTETFQKAEYAKEAFKVYPTVFKEFYRKSEEYIGYNLEGDKVRVTHWAIITDPTESNNDIDVTIKNEYYIDDAPMIPECAGSMKVKIVEPVTPSQNPCDKVSHDCHIEYDKVSHEN